MDPLSSSHRPTAIRQVGISTTADHRPRLGNTEDEGDEEETGSFCTLYLLGPGQSRVGVPYLPHQRAVKKTTTTTTVQM